MEKYIVLSNICTEPFCRPILQEKYGEQKIIEEVKFISYEEYQEQSNLAAIKETDCIIVWLNLEAIMPNIRYQEAGKKDTSNVFDEVESLCRKLVADLKERTEAKILWFSFENYSTPISILCGCKKNVGVTELNFRLQKLLPDDVTCIDLEQIIANVGIDNAFDIKNKHRWFYPYSKELTLYIVREIQKQYLIWHGITPKCIVLDCDNVLWGGVLSEDGIENIKIGNSGWGREYQDFQQFISFLYNHGIILAICSKNDLEDVLQVFREHNGMILKEDQIACFQVNWENKPANIREISNKLNINLDSIVFVDDSPIEINAVNELLPEVTTILYQREKIYRYFSCFNVKDDINGEEVIHRNETYRTNQNRLELKEECSTYDEYLESLEMQINIHEALPAEYGRISELTQRTNKCTNGVRITVYDLKKWEFKKDWHLYSVFLTDKFSDLGLVGTFGIQKDGLCIFSLSCRALGRGIEKRMISYIQENYFISSVSFNSTGKNRNLKLYLESELIQMGRIEG